MYGLSMADRRPVGIENSGNTCYCNAVVQILFTAEKFCMWFLQADARRLQPNPRSRFKGHLFTAWVKLLRQAFSRVPGGKPARPLNCTHLLALLRSQHPQFEINRQHDAHEFLRTLLDGLSADCNRIIKPRPRENLDDRRDESVEDSSERFWQSSLGEEQSLITDMFMGQQATRITCGTCRNVRHRFDPFLDLSIELDTPRASPFVTLDEILTASYVKGAEYRELDCPFCKRRRRAEIRQLLWRLPAEYLVIHVKRFRWNNSLATLSRINDYLDLPEDGLLDMGAFCPFSTHASIQDSVFVLEGIVCQSGTIDSGHYTAATVVGRQWWYFSDDTNYGIRELPDGRAIYLLLFRRAKSIHMDSSRRSRAVSVMRQTSANQRSQEAWASLTRYARRNISNTREEEHKADERSSSRADRFGSSGSSPEGSTRHLSRKAGTQVEMRKGAAVHYQGTVYTEQRMDHATRTASTNYSGPAAAERRAVVSRGARDISRSTGSFRTLTPAAHTVQRRDSSDVSLDMSRLCLERELLTSTDVGRRTPSYCSWRRRESSCQPVRFGHETEVYASPCFTRNYRQPSIAEVTLQAMQRVQRSGGASSESPLYRPLVPHAVTSPSRGLARPLPIHPMPARRQNHSEASRNVCYENQSTGRERRQKKETVGDEARRGTSHYGDPVFSSRHFI